MNTIKNILPGKITLIRVIKSAKYYIRTGEKTKTAISIAVRENVLKSKYILWNYVFFNFLLKNLVEKEKDIENEIENIFSLSLDEFILKLKEKYKKSSCTSSGKSTNVNLLTILEKINQQLPEGERFWFSYSPTKNWNKTKKGELSFITKGKSLFWVKKPKNENIPSWVGGQLEIQFPT